jgi:hypothetical protein
VEFRVRFWFRWFRSFPILVPVVPVVSFRLFRWFRSGCSGGFVPVVSGFSTCPKFRVECVVPAVVNHVTDSYVLLFTAFVEETQRKY